jgi:hypothetical protein
MALKGIGGRVRQSESVPGGGFCLQPAYRSDAAEQAQTRKRLKLLVGRVGFEPTTKGL